jgi:hypothetical protein
MGRVTTNIKTYIYVLKDPRTDLVRYVGKTVNLYNRYHNHINKAKNLKTHNDRWITVLLKINNKPILEVIDECYDDWEDKEKFYIKLFKSVGADLCNHTLGGEGAIGCIFTKERREKIAIGNSYKKGSPTEEARENMRKAQKLYFLTHKRPKGVYKQSEDIKKRIKEAQSVKVVQLTKNFEFVQEFSSIIEAAIKLTPGKQNWGNIAMCCKGTRKYALGYIWMYKETYNKLNNE